MARSGSFDTSLTPFGASDTDLTKYQIGLAGAQSAPPASAGTAPTQTDFGDPYWNQLLGSGQYYNPSQEERERAAVEANNAGDSARAALIMQGLGYGPDNMGTALQNQLVEGGAQMWVSAGTTAPVPIKPTVAPPPGVMPNPIIPAVNLPVTVAPNQAYLDLRAFMGVPIRG